MYVISELLQGCPNAKIIEVILENYDEDLTSTEIDEMADVDTPSYNYLLYLKKKGIIKQVREKENGEPVYRFNKDNPISKALILLEHQIVSTGLSKAIKEYKKWKKKKCRQKKLKMN